MDALLQLDSQLLLLLNYFHTEFWDKVFWLTSSTLMWIPMYAVMIYAIIKGQKWQSWVTVLAVIILVVLCDRISTDIFKYGFERFRPTHDPDLKDVVKTVFGYRGGKYGFVSSHAANTMGLAVLTSLIFRNRYYTIFMVVWSLVVAYSRIYLGVHFPGDVIGGLILGAVLAYLVYKLYVVIAPRFINLTRPNSLNVKTDIATQFSHRYVVQIIFVGILTFILIVLSSKVML